MDISCPEVWGKRILCYFARVCLCNFETMHECNLFNAIHIIFVGYIFAAGRRVHFLLYATYLRYYVMISLILGVLNLILSMFISLLMKARFHNSIFIL